jgi:hypothetical protein
VLNRILKGYVRNIIPSNVGPIILLSSDNGPSNFLKTNYEDNEDVQVWIAAQ